MVFTRRVTSLFLLLVSTALLTPTEAAPRPAYVQLRASSNTTNTTFQQQNGLAAQALNLQFGNLTESSPCTSALFLPKPGRHLPGTR
jgi:hypothetical protein